MGLRSGNQYGTLATVWKVNAPSSNGKTVDVQITTSKKNRQTDQYETDFNGYVRFCGDRMVEFASKLKEKDKIDIEAFDVTNKYDKEKKITYYNVSVFAAKMHEYDNQNNSSPSNSATGDGFMSIPDGVEDEGLPFN
ncbi:single-strand DNA-binding protein [Lacrimispora sphenoides]|uniref:hypothetical protein n=1 Tax=Lacrimispora sphenoides TaxID=29370 RepID=UPI0008B91468|nr:hypothetical protein [Lacrimispora sphenoides]SEU09729.1 single-strand DNA-binding protein [Lacrimispora sphenoides]